jgi:hypothetical protein
MVAQSFDQGMTDSVLTHVREGMGVYDANDHYLGKVERLYMGASSPTENELGEGAATAPNPDLRDDTLVDDIAKVFAPDDLPEVLRNRLLHNGFIRIDSAGLFAADRYVLPDQIAGVSGDRVRLKVSRDELIKR